MGRLWVVALLGDPVIGNAGGHVPAAANAAHVAAPSHAVKPETLARGGPSAASSRGHLSALLQGVIRSANDRIELWREHLLAMLTYHPEAMAVLSSKGA